VQIDTALRALGLGAATGLRTMAAPTAVFGGALLLVGAFAELVVDKLPSTPSRTQPVGLTARSIAAALAAGTYAKRAGDDPAIGGLLGVTGALAAAYLGAAYRGATARAGIPDLLCALLEDTVAYTTAFSIVH
jgi:uncharacterized membrane protein